MYADITSITFDAENAAELARFWAEVTGWDLSEKASEHYAAVGLQRRPEGAPALAFIKVPERKRAKNRVHLDLAADDPDAAVARFIELGARRVWDIDEGGWQWTTLADPEGNEFCVSKPHGA